MSERISFVKRVSGCARIVYGPGFAYTDRMHPCVGAAAPGRGATPTRSVTHVRTTAAAFLALGLSAVPLAAQEPAPEAAPERVRVVRPGDTLWEIARECLDDPFLWAEIYRLNADVVRDPALIHPGERLVLPACVGGEIARPAPQRGVAAGPEVREVTVTLSPVEAGAPVVPPGAFFRAGILAPDAEVSPVGVLAQKQSPTVVSLEGAQLISLYDRVYVKLAGAEGMRVGDPIHFFRRGREVKPFGRVYVSTGIAVVEELDREVATAVVRVVYDRITPGDLAVRPERFPVRPGVSPVRPARALEGRVVASLVPQPVHSTQDIVFLDVGEAAGVSAGDEFAAYLPPRQEPWGVRPEIFVGRLQVVRVTGATATARVVELEHPALEPGIPVRLVAEMP